MQFFSRYSFDSPAPFSTVFDAYKVVHIDAADPTLSLEIYYKQLAASCGFPLVYEEDPVSGAIHLNKWTEIEYLAEKSTDSYKHSNKAQPLHTDYGYFSFEIFASFFYCSQQAAFGGATTFIDADTVVEILASVDSSLLNRLQAQKIAFGRNTNQVSNNQDFILQQDELGWKVNWNYYRALGDEANQGLVNDFKAFLDHYIEKSGELKEIKLLPGEGVFFHDRRVIHGRNSFVGNRKLSKGGIAKSIPEHILQMFNLPK